MKREGTVLAETFGAAWLRLTVALVIYCLLDSPKPLLAHSFIEIFTSASVSGPCGGHAGGAGALVIPIVLICVVAAIVASSASWWGQVQAVFGPERRGSARLFAVTAALAGLVLRKVVRVASASVSR